MTPDANSESRSTSGKRSHIIYLDLVGGALALALGAWILYRMPDRRWSTSLAASIMLGEAGDWAWLLIISGLLLLLLHFCGRRNTSRFEPQSPLSDRIIFLVPAGLALALLINRMIATKTAILPWPGGERYFWLDDDMMISMRYAWNLANGHGLTWNAGEPAVEGYTNFLWTMILAIPHLVALPLRLTSASVLAINAALLLAALLLTLQLAKALKLSTSGRLIALLMIASNRWLIHWTAGGSEVVLMAALLLAASLLAMRARRNAPLGIGFGLVVGAVGLTRADGIVLIAGFAPALYYLFTLKRLRPQACLPIILLPLAHFAFSRIYYGEWLPNTYYLKAVDIPMKEAMGLHYIRDFFYCFAGICLLHLASVRMHRHPVARLLLLPPWVCIAYAVLVGGDELPELRFIVPVIPLLVVGAVAGCENIFSKLRTTREFNLPYNLKLAPAMYGWMVIALAIGGARSFALPYALSELGTNRGSQEKANVEIGLLLKKNTTPEARIAHFWAGAAPYFSERPAQDLLGKSDRHIAHLPGHPYEWPPGHTKYDAAYSLGLEPDVIVTAMPADRLDPLSRRGDENRIIYPGLYSLYDQPDFQTLYATGLVNMPLSADNHAIFIRHGTPRALPADQWKK